MATATIDETQKPEQPETTCPCLTCDWARARRSNDFQRMDLLMDVLLDLGCGQDMAFHYLCDQVEKEVDRGNASDDLIYALQVVERDRKHHTDAFMQRPGHERVAALAESICSPSRSSEVQ